MQELLIIYIISQSKVLNNWPHTSIKLNWSGLLNYWVSLSQRQAGCKNNILRHNISLVLDMLFIEAIKCETCWPTQWHINQWFLKMLWRFKCSLLIICPVYSIGFSIIGDCTDFQWSIYILSYLITPPKKKCLGDQT